MQELTLKSPPVGRYVHSVYQRTVERYGAIVGINVDVHGFCAHALRPIAATNALKHNADLAPGVPQQRSQRGVAPVGLDMRRRTGEGKTNRGNPEARLWEGRIGECQGNGFQPHKPPWLRP